MLRIQNIRSIEGTKIGDWKINSVTAANDMFYLKPHHYAITFERGEIGAGITIEREMSKYGYTVCICYEKFDNIIERNVFSSKRLSDKREFLHYIRHFLDTEYNKTK